MKYRITAGNLAEPLTIEADTEEEAWTRANLQNKNRLHDGKVELLPTREDLLTALAAADELEKAISNYEGDDYMDEIFKKTLAYRVARKATS